MKNKSKLAFVAGALLLSSNLLAQQGTVSTGGNGTGAGGSVSYTVGQTVYTSESGAGGTISQGIQQAYNVKVIVGIENDNIQLAVSAYPNPVVNQLILSAEQPNGKNLLYKLCDMNGKTLVLGSMIDTKEVLDVSNLPDSQYLLSVYADKELVKSFKIMKE